MSSTCHKASYALCYKLLLAEDIHIPLKSASVKAYRILSTDSVDNPVFKYVK
ncbi:MAG: hypothetical protein AWU56_1114 [Idiomarina sp. T82-3]|jgi:hypothetical protein|nr:MAG: hypothetical protein AWU56_1114 [Idiomarina sp. T82-3]